MFIKRLLFVSSLVISLIFGMIRFFSSINEEDRIAYQKLMDRGLEVDQKLASHQKRYNVHKTLLLSKGGHRLKSSLKCKSSELILNRETNHSEIVEQCKNVICYTQDSLIDTPPMQMISYLEADSAMYHYDTQELIADDMVMATYQEDGHQLIDPKQSESIPLMKGGSEAVDLSLGEDRHCILSGHVEIQHPLGQLSANRMQLIPALDDKFARIEMSEDVVIGLVGGGKLSCQKADLDAKRCTGVFVGNGANPDVMYEDSYKSKESGQNATAFSIKGHRMEVGMKPIEIAEKTSSNLVLNEIHAYGNIRVNSGNDYTLLADRAVYQHSNQGKLYLYPKKEEGGDCQVIHANGDRIQSEGIIADLQQKRLFFQKPEGVIKDQLEFSAKRLIWNDKENTLLLQKLVKINQKGVGEIVSEDEVKIEQEIVEGKKQIRLIEASQNTTLNYTDSKKSLTHKLTCHGSLKVDHASGRITMESPIHANSEVPQNLQVHFENVMGDVYADQAELKYKKNDNGWILSELHMEGHVRVFNRFDGHIQESSSILQYTLADVVDYFPEKREMLLSGLNRNRVLFMDRVNSIEMSAPSLIVRHDDKTSKNSVQGLGDVRFSFVERELEQLRSYFHFNEKGTNGKK